MKKSQGGKKQGAAAPGLRLEVGERYYQRNGKISEPIKINRRRGDNKKRFPFVAGFLSYAEDGRYWDFECGLDLVQKVESPKGSVRGKAPNRPSPRNSKVTHNSTRRSKP